MPTTGNDIEMKEWDVLVTLDATVSAYITVEAETEEQAGDKAIERKVVLENAPRFELDEDDFSSWASSAYLPDPDDGITPHVKTPDDLTETKRAIIGRASKAYSNSTSTDVDLLDKANPEVGMDGLALFISNELQDVMKGEPEENCREAAARSIDQAIKQLEQVLDAINDTQ